MLGIYGFSSPVTTPPLSTPYASLRYTLHSQPPTPTGMLDGNVPTIDLGGLPPLPSSIWMVNVTTYVTTTLASVDVYLSWHT